MGGVDVSEQPKKTSVKTRFSFIFLAMGAAIVVLFVATLVATFESNTRSSAIAHIKNIQGFYNSLVEEDIKMLSAALNTFIQDKTFQRLYAGREREKLIAEASPLFTSNRERYGITHFYFIDNSGVCYLRMHDPSLAGDVITRKTFDLARNTRDVGYGLELGKTAYALRVVMPYLSDGKQIGYAEFGEEIDHFDTIIKDKTGTDVVVLTRKELLSQEKYAGVRARSGAGDAWDELKDYVVVSETFGAHDAFVSNIVDEKELDGIKAAEYLGNVRLNGRVLMKGAFPFYDVGKNRTGVVFTLTDITEQVHDFWTTLIAVVVVGVLILVVFFIAALRNLQVNIVNPLIKLTTLADTISKGKDLDHELFTDRTDEIGMLTRAFDRMRVSTAKLTKRLLGNR